MTTHAITTNELDALLTTAAPNLMANAALKTRLIAQLSSELNLHGDSNAVGLIDVMFKLSQVEVALQARAMMSNPAEFMGKTMEATSEAIEKMEAKARSKKSKPKAGKLLSLTKKDPEP